MNTENFLDELLKEAEQTEQIQSRSYCDLILKEISNLKSQIDQNTYDASVEIEIINRWLEEKNASLKNRIQYYEGLLENYMRHNNLKTLDLPNGILKVRKNPDKIEITNIEAFLRNARPELIRIIPEEIKPDLNKIKSFIKATGEIPAGVTFIEGTEQFTYKLKQQNKETNDEPET